MKIFKIILIVLSLLLISFMLFALVASTSFKNMFYNKNDDSLIVIIRKDNSIDYTYTKNNIISKGKININHKGIVFMAEEKKVALAKYNTKGKEMIITGIFKDNKYKSAKYRQITSIFTYMKAIF